MHKSTQANKMPDIPWDDYYGNTIQQIKYL